MNPGDKKKIELLWEDMSILKGLCCEAFNHGETMLEGNPSEVNIKYWQGMMDEASKWAEKIKKWMVEE